MDKHTCFERAKQLLKVGDEASLRYAALELRCCMEVMTYQKLEAMKKLIPEELLNQWQPPQAVKALLEHDPNADKSWKLAIAKEDEAGKPSEEFVPLGEHSALKVGWLRKHYNKIGSFLHAPKPKQSAGPTAEYLEAVIKDLEPAVASTLLGGWIGVTHHFLCAKCKRAIICLKDRLEKNREVKCPYADCGAEHVAAVSEDKTHLILRLRALEFECDDCHTSLPLEERHVAMGYAFVCPTCKAEYEIAKQTFHTRRRPKTTA